MCAKPIIDCSKSYVDRGKIRSWKKSEIWCCILGLKFLKFSCQFSSCLLLSCVRSLLKKDLFYVYEYKKNSFPVNFLTSWARTLTLSIFYERDGPFILGKMKHLWELSSKSFYFEDLFLEMFTSEGFSHCFFICLYKRL